MIYIQNIKKKERANVLKELSNHNSKPAIKIHINYKKTGCQFNYDFGKRSEKGKYV